eukprot:2262677-Prorocentrum_lima.AAC.1
MPQLKVPYSRFTRQQRPDPLKRRATSMTLSVQHLRNGEIKVQCMYWEIGTQDYTTADQMRNHMRI